MTKLDEQIALLEQGVKNYQNKLNELMTHAAMLIGQESENLALYRTIHGTTEQEPGPKPVFVHEYDNVFSYRDSYTGEVHGYFKVVRP